jgi:hypothetical protein
MMMMMMQQISYLFTSMLSIIILALLLSSIRVFSKQQYGCINEDGILVDTWVTLTQNIDYLYYYYDNDNTHDFIKSLYTTNQTKDGCIMNTMNQLYTSDIDLENIAYVLYNDEPPPDKTESSSYAHSKGIMMMISCF